jgi:tetratricopeptide (TPR) repeat protein
VSRLLDDYASRWSDMYTDACEATQVRGDQSSEVMDLRMTCLEGPRASLRALTEELSRADRAVLVHAVNAAQALPPIDRCLDVSALRASVPPPADAALRARVGALRLELPRIQALSDTGQWMEARGSIEPIVAAARTLGYGPLIAEALKPLGWLQYFMGDVELAADTMESALWAAVASHQDDVALDCAAYLVAVAGYHLGHYADAARWEQFGRALLGRLGPGHEAAQAWLLHNRGLNRQRQGNYQAALADLEEGLAMKRRILPPNHPDIGIVLEAIANVRTDMKDKEGAVAAIREALAIFEKAYGSSSPLLARTLGNLGEIERTRGDYAAAERDLRASIDRWREQVPPDHPWIAYPLTQLGKTLASEHRPEEAIVVLERALRIREHAEPTVELIAETRFALARALWQSPSGRTRAGRLAEQALEGYREAKGHEQDATAVSAWLGEQRRGASDRHRSAVEAPGRGVAANQTQLGFTHGTHVRVLPLLRPEGPPDRAVRASRKHVDTTVAP